MNFFNWNLNKEDVKDIEKDIKSALNGTDFTDKEDENGFIGQTIYPNNGTLDDCKSKYRFTHRFLKYSMAVPLLNVFMKKYRDKTIKELPDLPQYKKLNAFNKAYDKSIRDWNTYYQSINEGKIASKEEIDKKYDDRAAEYLKFMKEVTLTICANDTAYLEFMNILMLNLKKELEFVDNQHLFYIDKNMNEPTYFLVMNQFPPENRILAKKLVDGYVRCAEIVKKEDGNVELKVWENEMPRFVKSTDLPQK